MFGAIAKLFGKRTAAETPPAAASAPAPRPQPSSAPAKPVSQTGTRPVPVLAVLPNPAPRAGLAPASPHAPIEIPFASVLRSVPQELWGKLAPAGAAGHSLRLSRQEVLQQLPKGAVKVPFSALRQEAPAGLFANNPARDGELVEMPLREILEQLRPEALARRPDQGRVAVSEEVPDIFGNRQDALAGLRVMQKNEVANPRQTTPAPAPAPAPEPAPAEPPSNLIPMPGAAPAATPALPPRTITPVATPSVQTPPQARSTPTPAAATPAPPIPFGQPTPAKPPVAPPTPRTPVAAAPVAAAPAAPPAPRPLPKPAPSSAPNTPPPGTFLIAIKEVAERWPADVRNALAQLKVPDARLALPAVDVCEGLKRRHVQFRWGTLRGWIYPTPPSPVPPSALDDTVLELPLEQLTPLFLDFIRSSPAHRKVADSRTITEFFRRTELEAGRTSAIPAPVTPAPAAPAPAPASPTPAPSAAAPAAEGGHLEVAVSQVCADWPGEIRRDMEQFQLLSSTVFLPLEYVEAGVKAGRVEFSWRQVIAWLRPACQPAQLSIHGELRVSFPLALIAPLFLQKTSGNRQPRRRTVVDQAIPDLFNAQGVPNPTATQAPPSPAPATPARTAEPAPVAATAPAPTPAPAPAPSPADAPAAPAAPPKPGPRNLAQLFNEPEKRNWTPNDIVHYSARLPGVAGALIALQDGLLVAAAMPPQVRGETVAAFVPQIFGRMGQYTRELQLGEVKAVSFTVESGTLQVFNAGIIYYAVLSKPDTALPFADLQLIARELSRHTK
ncbi:MAG: hypothetical protein RJA22_2153 [Verrucomicrobiota bacterium]